MTKKSETTMTIFSAMCGVIAAGYFVLYMCKIIMEVA